MRTIKLDKVEVHVFRRRAGRVEFLMLRRAKNRKTWPGIWQPVTGGVRRGEPAFAAARRELREETTLDPAHWWALEQPTTFYEPATDSMVLLPVFVAEIGAKDCVVLSAEHDAMKFAPAATASRQYLWDTQRIALAAIKRTVLRGGPQAHARKLRVKDPRTS